MRRAAAAGMAAGVFAWAGAAAAQGRGLPTDGAVSFSYRRDPEVAGCTQGDEASVRDLVEGVMHVEPFVRAGEAAAMELRVSVARRGARVIRATFELWDAGGKRGTSHVEDERCDDVHLKLAASIGLLLERRAPAPVAVVVPQAAARPGCDAACRAGVKEELRGEVREEVREEEREAVRREVRRWCKEKYCPGVDVVAVIGVGALVGFNYAADPAPGFWLTGEARGPWWSGTIEARGVLPTRAYTLLNKLGTVDFGTFSGVLSPCLRWKWLSGCALAEVGVSIHSIPGSYDDGASEPFFGLGVRGRVDIPITRGIELRVFGDLMGYPVIQIRTLSDPTGPGGFDNPAISEYEAPRRFGGFVGLGLAKAFE